MPRDPSPAAKWSQYLALRALVGLAHVLGVRISLLIAATIGRLFFRFDKKHRRRSINHVRLAFPSWEESRIEDVARRSCQRFLQLAVEMVFMPRRIRKSNYERHLVRRDPISALDLFYAREPMVMAVGHFGNWEAAGYFFSLEGHAIAATARPLDNPLINNWMLNARRRHGMNVIEKWDNADVKIIKALENREAIAFVADQNGGPRGVFVPFFGRLASTPKTVGLLAMHRGVSVLVGYARRIDPWKLMYEIVAVDLIRPADWADSSDPLFYITARYVRAIEQAVREHPADYLWMHRRWKSRPRFDGKPMPESFKTKLRELPWMDEQQIAQLQEPLGFDHLA